MKKVLFFLSFLTFLSCNNKNNLKMDTQSKVSVLIRFKPKNGMKAELVKQLIHSADTLTPNEDGTEIWTVSTTPTDEEAVYVYEVYSSGEAKAQHETGEAYATVRQKINELVDGMPQVIPLIPQGGKGLKK
jgi:quinol monooxygenase YgiN